MSSPSRPFSIRACLSLLLSICAATPVFAAEWTVMLDVHNVLALTNSDAASEQDMYRKIWIEPLIGSGPPAYCDNEDNRDDDNNHVTPSDWGCTMKVTGGANTLLKIKLELWDDDDLVNPDDELDLNPSHSQLGLEMRFEPRTAKLIIVGAGPGGADIDTCAMGHRRMSGFGGGGEEPANITFSISSSAGGDPAGDTDGDKLLDTWEVCGFNSDDDRDVDLDLKAMGANPFRKDVFVEVDWMTQATHTHEPWLPALIQAWTEYDRAAVTNPTVDGIPNPSGIALHLDVGPLYVNYNLNIDGAGANEFAIGTSGNIDLDLNPSTNRVSAIALPPGSQPTDIGNFGGGNFIPEITPLLQSPPPFPGFFQQGSTFEIIKNGAPGTPANFDPARLGIFHYALFSHALQIVGPVGPGTVGLAEGGSQNDDMTIFLAPLVAAPGAQARQTIDANRDGVPDAGAAQVFGPLGRPVDGTVNNHASVFIHELGHNLGLDHGAFNLNGSPNYLSIMNVAFFNGVPYDNIFNDGIGDTTGVDYDADGITDVVRFHFSHKLLGMLNEGALNENAPIDPQPNPILSRHTCPTGAVPPAAPFVRSDGPVNWDCDGTLGETGAAVNNNNINNYFFPPTLSAVNELLLGYDDHVRLQGGGLQLLPDPPKFGGPGPSPSIHDVDLMDSHSQRIREPSGREWFAQRCERPRKITFEEFPEDTRVDEEYAPAVHILSDGLRKPVIVGPSGRNGVVTASPDRSLLNGTTIGTPAPLVMTFGEPQRAVRLRVGHAGFTRLPRERARAVLRAFDVRGLPMGMIVRDIAQSQTGVNQFITAVAVLPHQLIQRVELSFATDLESTGFKDPKLVDEPVLIDDLEICERLDETGLKPFIPPSPKFGDFKVSLTVQSEAVHQTGAMTPEGKPVTVRMPFTGLPVKINGANSNTGTSLTRPEGTKLNISAPAIHSGWKFLHWRHSSGVSFSNGMTAIPLTLLRDGTLTAVYEGHRARQPIESSDPVPHPADCECCCKCPGEREPQPRDVLH